jgi:DNA transposition AAA+ family ATPase
MTTTAPLTNVGLCLAAMQQAMERPRHLPGMVTLYGPSGWGKTTAAIYVANQTRAYYVQANSSWTRKAMLLATLKSMGIHPYGTIYRMTEQVAEQLTLSRRPLIVDEMDHLVDRNAVEVVRDIYEASGAAILLIGEERLPAKLKRWERFHGRMLDWIPAQPANLHDAAHLRTLYCQKVVIANDLLARIVEMSRGSIRRICVNLERTQSEALRQGLENIDLEQWGNRELFTGEAPRRRVA